MDSGYSICVYSRNSGGIDNWGLLQKILVDDQILSASMSDRKIILSTLTTGSPEIAIQNKSVHFQSL